MQASPCAGTTGIGITRVTGGMAAKCCCNTMCADKSFVGFGFTRSGHIPAIWTPTFTGVVGCVGCQDVGGGKSANSSYVLAGSFDLFCIPFPITELAYWEFVSPPGDYGTFANADTTCTTTETLAHLRIQIKIPNAGPNSCVIWAGLSRLPNAAAGPNAGFDVRLFTATFSMTSADCTFTITRNNTITTCGSAQNSVNRNGSVTMVPS